MTGLIRAQLTRLITRYLNGEEVKPKAYQRYRFPNLHTAADAEFLANVDEEHETLSGAVIRKHIGYGHIAPVRAEAFQAF